jgi:hypothetical protein
MGRYPRHLSLSLILIKRTNSEGLISHGAEDFTIQEKTPKKTCLKQKCQHGVPMVSTIPIPIIPPNPTHVTPTPTILVVHPLLLS